MAAVPPRVYVGLAVFQAVDAAICVRPIAPIAAALRAVGFPLRYRWILVAAKAASAVGLLAAPRYPALGRLTTAMLALYFTLAVGFHLRARDISPGLAAASSFLALYGALTVRGPAAPR
ncbi:DoxX family protein [Mycobacterium sp. MYCO198283]|uniref:DoxX family protein n=1 Tax=Mycobacterium sp. MYCO198283 TaxID=2883505 RepID=UPI001E45E18F|nr:DoxX family protein [Mycobacterium sp. MYCO198283]MCG5433543.1 DoxX family protein [Mycobacterium sp. MYCO198283]